MSYYLIQGGLPCIRTKATNRHWMQGLFYVFAPVCSPFQSALKFVTLLLPQYLKVQLIGVFGKLTVHRHCPFERGLLRLSLSSRSALHSLRHGSGSFRR